MLKVNMTKQVSFATTGKVTLFTAEYFISMGCDVLVTMDLLSEPPFTDGTLVTLYFQMYSLVVHPAALLAAEATVTDRAFQAYVVHTHKHHLWFQFGVPPLCGILLWFKW